MKNSDAWTKILQIESAERFTKTIEIEGEDDECYFVTITLNQTRFEMDGMVSRTGNLSAVGWLPVGPLDPLGYRIWGVRGMMDIRSESVLHVQYHSEESALDVVEENVQQWLESEEE